jgi:hypothetical protein
MSEDYNIKQLLRLNYDLEQYIQESIEIETADIYVRSESARGLKQTDNFNQWKGRFSSKKQLWTYIYNKQYHKLNRNNVRISDILKNPIARIDAWEIILDTLENHKTAILDEINSIPDSRSYWNRRKIKFSTIRSSIIIILDKYINQIQTNIDEAEQIVRKKNEAQRKERSMFRRQKIAQQAREYKRVIALRKTQQEKMREERKRIEEENRRREERNRQLKEEIRRKKENKRTLQRTLKAARAVTRIRNTPKCKKYENDVNMYEKALERQEQYIAGNCNRKGCNDDDIDNLDRWKKKVEENKKTQQTAIDNNQCPRTVKLKF